MEVLDHHRPCNQRAKPEARARSCIFEKKTLVLHEVKVAKDGRRHGLLFFPGPYER
jgi:hypothetical protein